MTTAANVHVINENQYFLVIYLIISKNVHYNVKKQQLNNEYNNYKGSSIINRKTSNQHACIPEITRVS